MKVNELQQFLGGMTPFVRAAGASEKVATELDHMVQCLEPFKEKTLAEFNDFLRRADEFDRTGQLQPPKRKSSAKPRTPKAPALTVDAAVVIYKDMLARVADPTLTYTEIDTQMEKIGKLSKPQVMELSAKVDVPVPKKSKTEALAALTRWVKELKVSDERTRFKFGETA